MKKIFVGLVMLIGLLSVASSQSIFEAIYNDDITAFTKCVKKKKSLEEKTELGMPVQLAIAQFSDENFEKACQLLAAKKFDFDKPSDTGMTLLYLLTKSLSVNKVKALLNYDVDVNKKVAEILPIQATQFSTYPFHTKQDIASENYEKEKEIHKMLLEKGSEPFSYIDANLFYFGNFLFAYATVVFQSNRLIKPEMLNSAEFFDIKEKNKRTIASFKYEAMKEILNQYGILIRNVESSRHTDDFINVINDVLTCSNKCYVLAFTGNSKIAPYQWVLIKNFDEDTINNLKVKNEEAKFMCINSDSTYAYAEYYIKDITEVIVIKVLGK